MKAPDVRNRVLIIYPPGASARGMAEALTAEGVGVTIVDNVFRAVSAFTLEPADLVFLGVAHLDDRDLDVIRILRELSPEVYVLLAFPPSHRERTVKALALGADSYILEPFYLEEFLDIVRRGLLRSGRRPGDRGRAELDSGTLEELTAAVSHAVNNPLQVVELMLTEKEGLEAKTGELREEAERIGAVVTELLEFSRRLEVQPAPLDLNELLRRTVPESERKGQRVRHDLGAELPDVNGDAERLRTAFRTLGGLAQHLEKKKDHLVIRTEEVDDLRGSAVKVEFEAADLELTPQQTDEFFRPYRSLLGGAVGLAAATARCVVLAHGGTIEVTSGPKQGTRIILRLPAAGASA